jgi:hypothetical protein
LHRDLGGSVIDVTQISRRKFNGDGSNVFLQTMQLCGAWNGDDPRSFPVCLWADPRKSSFPCSPARSPYRVVAL